MFLKNLPDEILGQILASNGINIRDLGSLMLTSKYLRNVIRNSQELWKKKLLTRYKFYTFFYFILIVCDTCL